MGERTRVELYVHLVWGTFRRRPLISADIEADVFRVVAAKSLELHCVPCAIGGTEDHLHLLTRLHPSTPVARLVAEVKGVSSHLVTHRLAPGCFFRWQSGYGAFTISSADVPAVERYLLNQKQQHANWAIEPTLELEDP
jgi:REP element-mobilizing transposase RayT